VLKKRVEKVSQVLVIIIGVLLLLDAVIIAFMTNFDIGQVALAVFAIALILYGIFWYRDKVAKWVHAAVIVLCTVLVVFSGFLALYGSNDTVEYDEDVVIVLGAAVQGEQVSLTLAHRLDKALEYHTQNPHAIIVVSGGQGSQESISEALAMERYLLVHGVPKELIIREERSTSTYENFLFSSAILQEEFPSSYSAAFITTDFHIYRATGIAERVGLSVRHMGSASVWYAFPVNYMREMMAVIQFWFVPPST